MKLDEIEIAAAKEVLRKAVVLLRPPEAWTQGRAARDASLQSVAPESPDAVCWCALGAVQAISPGSGEATRLRTRAYWLLGGVIGSRALVNWNDAPERTHAEVIQAFEKAAA